MDERRKLHRKHLVHQLMAFDRNTDQLAGYLVNLTAEGVMLVCEDPLEVGTILKLRMLLPSKIIGSRHVAFDAQVIWCREHTSSGFHETGFQLLEIPEDEIERVKRLIDLFGTLN